MNFVKFIPKPPRYTYSCHFSENAFFACTNCAPRNWQFRKFLSVVWLPKHLFLLLNFHIDMSTLSNKTWNASHFHTYTHPYRTNLSSLYIWFNTLHCQTALWPPNSSRTKTTSEQKECLRAFYALHNGIFLLARERWVLCNFELVIIYSEMVPATNFNYSQFHLLSFHEHRTC